jgi:hypothetical protein
MSVPATVLAASADSKRKRHKPGRQAGTSPPTQVAMTANRIDSGLFRYPRLNEVVLPSAPATDASRVVIFRRMMYRADPRFAVAEQSSDFLEVFHFQSDTIQIP